MGSVIYDIIKIFDKIDKNKFDTFEKFKEEYWRKELVIKLPVMFGVAARVFPLCLLKDVSRMRFASIIGVFALIYSIIVIIIESLFFLKYQNWDLIGNMNWFDITNSFSYEDGIPFFGGISTVLYIFLSCWSFSCI